MRRALEPFRLACLHTCCQTSALSTTPRRWLNVVTLRGNARGGCSRRGQSGVGATALGPGPAARPRGGIGGEEIGASGGGAYRAGGAAAPALALMRGVAPPQPGRGRAAAGSALLRRSDAREGVLMGATSSRNAVRSPKFTPARAFFRWGLLWLFRRAIPIVWRVKCELIATLKK